MSFVTDKVKNLPASGIRKFFDVAAEMTDVVSLGVGEPDFFTPWNVREEAIYSLERRRTAYTSNAGLPALREAVCNYMQRFALKYDPREQVVITVGVSEAIDIALRAVLAPGDEVLVVEPCYVSYRACVILAGGVPVSVVTHAENNFRVQPDDILEKITPRTKAIILCYPNNPTGAIMEREDLEKIAAFFRNHPNILIISDEVYAELTFTEADHISIAALPDMYERTLVLNGFSKAFAMTGWRLGYACGPTELIAAMVKIHQYVIMCAPTTAQLAGVEALQNGLEGVEKMRDEYNGRRRLMLDAFREMNIPCFEPLGAFYLLPSIAQTGLSSEDFCTRLLMEKRLAIVPGTAFGECGEGFVRCSYAYSVAELQEALRRLRNFIG